VDIAADELARALGLLKIVFHNDTGGLFYGVTGEGQDVVHLDDLMKQPRVMGEVKKLLDYLPRSLSVAVISANSLQQDLFTDSGAGTLICRGCELLV
jgi:N-acetyl-gamma-glutamyl-phosphate reductase/acetylglutamate kinase